MKTYVLINSKTDNYIGIDRGSGGYPFDTENLGNAFIWDNKEDAKKYAEMWPNETLSLHEVVCNKYRADGISN